MGTHKLMSSNLPVPNISNTITIRDDSRTGISSDRYVPPVPNGTRGNVVFMRQYNPHRRRSIHFHVGLFRLSLHFLSWELDLFELIRGSALSWIFWCFWLLTASRFEALFEELQFWVFQ
ncbi:hypothetical protein C4D60_Mb01t10500 [Musa balbisiana]|uniref:Uncharacterized protein n=1 Tax=Musa balbisiana TaxID=52838 RepID=A0A4V4H797_MUSBA|nr:hypothetical protein C4D60_Mb01t10500 [Musa balbisiana]